jgi:hypothetical protein
MCDMPEKFNLPLAELPAGLQQVAGEHAIYSGEESDNVDFRNRLVMFSD